MQNGETFHTSLENLRNLHFSESIDEDPLQITIKFQQLKDDNHNLEIKCRQY